MQEFPDLEDIYDEATVRAIEVERREPAVLPARRRENLAVAGALTASMLRGVGDVLETDDEEDAIVEVLDETQRAQQKAVSVHLVWGEPAASIAIVRRWLL